jgi:hypothetical protein
MKQTWFALASEILVAMGLVWGVMQYILNRGRKQASVIISNTEAETYKKIVENKLADLNLSDIIETKVQYHLKQMKDMLWSAQEEHFKVKLDMQERLIKSLKEKNEVEQENDILKNELQEIREEYQACHREVTALRKEVAELRKLNNKL